MAVPARTGLLLAIALPALAVLLAPARSAAAVDPFVRIENAKLERGKAKATVHARIEWNRAGIDERDMVEGDVRLLAVSRNRNTPTELDDPVSRNLAGDPVQEVDFELSSPEKRRAIRPGNRVVLTATQHAPRTPELLTPRSYVTVEQLQEGAARGPVGRSDCSDRPIEVPAVLERCDLVGASLARARVSTLDTKTRLLRADLTGADLRGADLGDADIAGGRVNGADATGATIDGVSLAGGEGIGLVAPGTTFESSDLFDARLDDARLQGATFEGTSLAHSRFDDARLGGATIIAADMNTVGLVGADLTGATLQGDTFYFADLTRASLLGATLIGGTPDTLFEFSLLCHTKLPAGEEVDRDCTDGPGPAPKPAGTPFVDLDADLRRRDEGATIEARIRWDVDGMTSFEMVLGELRAVAIDARSGMPTALARAHRELKPEDPSERVTLEIDRDELDTLGDGNRVVLTATQHPPRPDPEDAGDELTPRSYVTVDQLRTGPNRGRVGGVNCADRPIGADAGAAGLRFCDLAGADLASADLSKLDLRMAELSGADLRGAGLGSSLLDGVHAAGVPASAAQLSDATFIAAFAPGLSVRSTLIRDANFFAAALRGADFADSRLFGTAFATAGLKGGSSFARTRLEKVDLAYAELDGADISGATAIKTSLFLADLTDATLRGSTWTDDEEGRDPPPSATLCRTTMPNGSRNSRDCQLR